MIITKKSKSSKASSTTFGLEAHTFRSVQHHDPILWDSDYGHANPPFNDSDWFRKDDDVRWQWSGARSTAKGRPQGERGGVHQFGTPFGLIFNV